MSFGSVTIPGPPAVGSVSALVHDGFSSAQLYAQQAFAEATSFLQQLEAAAHTLAAIPAVDGILSAPAEILVDYVAPAVPTTPTGLALNLPATPADPGLATVAPLSVGAAPTFTVAAPNPDFSFAAPAPFAGSVPLEPGLAPVVVPGAPSVALPSVPTLLGIDVPTPALLNLPIFNVVLPGSPLAPAYIFSFTEPGYTSGLLTDLRARLQEWVDGASTGLAPTVEQALWDRERTRENTLLARKSMEVRRDFASRGFAKPPGALAVALGEALQATQSTLSGLSREIAIKQADLEQSNRRFAFEQAWKVEEGLITYQNQIAQRAFETAKYVQQAAIDLYHETVVGYVASVQAYGAQVEAYKAALQAELSKLEIYKAQLEGQKLIGELNVQTVEIYKAEVEAARATVDIFRAQVEAANTVATVNKTTIDGYAASVGAYGESVRAKTAEYQGYQTRVQAQVAIVDAYKAQADAYGSVIQGFRATVDAGVAAKNIEIKIGQEVPLDVFKTRTEVYRTEVSAEAERVGAVVKAFEAQTQVFGAQVQGETARVGAEVNIFKAETEVAVAAGNLRIEALKANVQALIQETNLLIEAIKGGAQVSAQLAAAALSAVNLSGQIGDHNTTSTGFNYNTSQVDSNSTTSATQNSTSTSTQNVTSESTQNSTSDVTQHIYNITA